MCALGVTYMAVVEAPRLSSVVFIVANGVCACVRTAFVWCGGKSVVAVSINVMLTFCIDPCATMCGSFVIINSLGGTCAQKGPGGCMK